MWLLQHHKLNNFLKSLFKKRFLNFSMWLINHCFCSTFMSKIKDTRLVFIHAGKMFWFLSTKVHCVAPAKGRLCVHNNRRGHLSKELFWAWHLKTGLKTCVERKQNCGCKALSLIQKKKKKDQSVPLLFWHLRTVTYWIIVFSITADIKAWSLLLCSRFPPQNLCCYSRAGADCAAGPKYWFSSCSYILKNVEPVTAELCQNNDVKKGCTHCSTEPLWSNILSLSSVGTRFLLTALTAS